MSGTRRGTYRSDVRGRRSIRGRRTNSPSAQHRKFSPPKGGEQRFLGTRRKPLFVSASGKTVAREPLVKEIFIEAPPSVVFQFLTDPAKIIRWLGIGVEIDPRPGGIYRLDLNGRDAIRGEYLEVLPDTRLVFTWVWEKPGYGVFAGSTRVEIDLWPDGKGTRARLSHRQALSRLECAP